MGNMDAIDLLIASENDHLFNNTKKPIVVTYDDHLRHMRSHVDFMNNLNILTFEQRDRFRAHIDEHNKVLMQSQTAVSAKLYRSKIVPAGHYWYHIDDTYGEIFLENHDNDLNFYIPKKGWEWFIMGTSGYLEGNSPDNIVFYPSALSAPVSIPIPSQPNNWQNGITQHQWLNTNTGAIMTHNGIQSGVALEMLHKMGLSEPTPFYNNPAASCCSNVKNLDTYINFYDRKVRYCKCCGKEVI